MPAVIHCVRHAQGFHNLGPEFWSLPDPKLTPVGEEQCHTLRDALWADQSRVSLIAASPLSRTIHTASIVFEQTLSNNKTVGKILAIPDAQEISDLPADIGSDPDVIRRICAEEKWPVDLSLVHEGWNVKTVGSRYSPASHSVKKRARDARRLLREKVKELEASGIVDPQIVLVSHGGYLHYFTDDWEDSNKLVGTGWENCETRSFAFLDEDGDQDAHLIELMASRKRRGLSYPMLSSDEQAELFTKSMNDWRAQGLKDGLLYEEQPAPLLDHEKREVEVTA